MLGTESRMCEEFEFFQSNFSQFNWNFSTKLLLILLKIYRGKLISVIKIFYYKISNISFSEKNELHYKRLRIEGVTEKKIYHDSHDIAADPRPKDFNLTLIRKVSQSALTDFV